MTNKYKKRDKKGKINSNDKVDKNSNCIFCKIARHEIPSYIVYEDKDVLAFLDIKPVSKGHTTIITKKHFTNISDSSEDILKKIIIAVKKVSNALMKVTKAKGFNVCVNNFRAAGQAINHLHFHIIPRYENDGLTIDKQPRSELKNPKEIVSEMKRIMKN